MTERRGNPVRVVVLEACGDPIPADAVSDCVCGHPKAAHTFNERGVPLAFGGSNCDECWDCPRYCEDRSFH